MAAMTGQEFQEAVLSADQQSVELYTQEQFAVVSASIIAQIAVSPERYSKELLVEVLQKLAIKMPLELVVAGTLHTMTVLEKHKDLTV